MLLQDDAAAAHWFPVESPPPLAFDHKLIIREAFETLTSRPEVAGNGAAPWLGQKVAGVSDCPVFLDCADAACFLRRWSAAAG